MSDNLRAVLAELKEKSDEYTLVPLPDDALLEKYQSDIGLKFPENYKTFLKEVMNVFYGRIDPLVVTETGSSFAELRIALQSARQAGVPEDWIPICEDNGDFYCIVPGGRVRFWSHDGESSEEWLDIASWIKSVWIDGN